MTKIQNKIFSLLFAFFAFLAPVAVLAATDLGINANGVWLSVPLDKIEVNQTVRIYSRVENVSDEDAIAEVEFYIDDVRVGARSITVLAGEKGVAFWDWKTPVDPTQFTLSVRIHDQEGKDTNPNNDTVTLYQLWVNVDTDADQVYNRLDNCPAIVNTDQADTDKDGIGDACEEKAPAAPAPTPAEQPTQPNDSAPDQPAETTLTAPTAVPTSEAENVALDSGSSESETSSLAVEETTMPADHQEPPISEGQDADLAAISGSTDLNEVFVQAEQLSWNSFRFRPSSRLGAGSYEYIWDLGDGTVSSERVVEHTYRKPGRYSVNAQLIDQDGGIQSSTVLVRVGFFNLANWRLWIIIALLALIIIVAAMTAGVTDAIVPPVSEFASSNKPMEIEKEEVEMETLSQESGGLDAFAATGVASEALGSELSLLESLDHATIKPEPTEAAPSISSIGAASDEPTKFEKPVAKKKTITKKKPGKKRAVKVKRVS